MVTPDLDIGRNQVADGGQGAAKEDVFSRSFEIIVDDVKRTRAVPRTQRLSVETTRVNVGDMGVADGYFSAVDTNTTLHVPGGKAVNIRAIDNNIVRHLGAGLLPVADAHELVYHRTVSGWCDFQSYKTVVMTACRGLEHWFGGVR